VLVPAADGKTKSLVSALSKVSGASDKKVLLVLDQSDEKVFRAGRNVEKLAINLATNLQVGSSQTLNPTLAPEGTAAAL